MDRKGFTLIELLIVIGLLAVLATATVLIINPAELSARSRDTRRIDDLQKISSALKVYETQAGVLGGNANTVYISLPNTSSNCTGTPTYALPALPTGWSYNCVTEANFRNINGTGWIPVNFSQAPGLGIATLPIDPVNSAAGSFYYTYIKGSWSLTSALESTKFLRDYLLDGGTDPARLEVSNNKAVWTTASGLIGYWPFDEGSGTTAADMSGKNNTGTLTNSPAWIDGKVGRAINFDGIDDFINFAALSSVNQNYLNVYTGEAKTLMAWFKGVPTTTDATILWKESGCIGWYIHMRSTGIIRVAMSTGTGCTDRVSHTQSSANSYGDDVWHHVAAVIDRHNQKLDLYIDGALVRSGSVDNTGGGQTGGGTLRIGTNHNNTLPFKGLIDDVRIYGRALSASEIEALYNATK